MTLTNNYMIPEETVQKIKDTAVLDDVIADFTELSKKGSNLEGKCTFCNSKKLSVSPSKSIYKCWSCNQGGNNAVQFLIEMQGMNYIESLKYLAKKYNISIEETPKEKKRKTPNRAVSFRNEQLQASGIPEKAQQIEVSIGEGKSTMLDRYQGASIDKAFNVIPGDDMVLHYFDLDGKPMQYALPNGKKKVLTRVRWSNPELHLDKNGNPIKYQSPKDSGSHIWIPNRVIKAYQTHEIFETLYIDEGEKKADRSCEDDMYAVGTMGIHNFGIKGDMPAQFERLIKRCGVRRVVFRLDSDWQEISLNNGKAADSRPRTFYRAVQKFRDYFYAYTGNGIYLDIFFAYGKEKVYKGIDDLMCRGIEEDGPTLKDDFEAAFISRDGIGKYINVHKITDTSDYQLKEYWDLHSPKAFMDAHTEQLKQLRDFQYNKLRWRWNEEEGEFQLAQKIMPHEQFWDFKEDRQGNVTPFYIYQNMRVFLNNRGYGQYEYNFDQYRFVHVMGRIVREIGTSHIRRMVRDFVEDIGEKQVLEMILRGGNAYMGADKLADLYVRDLEWMEGDRDTMYLFFNDQYWHITANSIESRPLNEMPKYAWRENLIDFSPKLFDERMLDAERNGDHWRLNMSEEGKKCDMCMFLINTSNFHWRKQQRLVADENGKLQYVAIDGGEAITDEEVKLYRDHFMAKVLATGYIMHDYLDYSLMKAVVCMDGDESEVGRSQGGTGKSIWSDQFDMLVPMEVIDGKSKTIEDDKHVYELVDERTRVITFDDVRVNFNFEWLFSQITRGILSNPKGQKRIKLKPKKFIVNTNHALNGEGNSFKRRQYMLGFSDYYNEYRTPYDDFGYQLFHDWEYEERNRYYNWIANCMQLFLRYRLDYTIPGEALERRRLRQQIGESFIEWGSLVFDQEMQDGQPMGLFLNIKIERTFLYEKYLTAYPEDKKYTTSRTFKEKLIKYCQYAGLTFNPTTNGNRLRSDSKEYFIIADTTFNASIDATEPIQSEYDLQQHINFKRR